MFVFFNQAAQRVSFLSILNIGVLVFLNKDYFDQTGLDHSYDELRIPFAYIKKEDGLNLLNQIGSSVKIDIDAFGVMCIPNWLFHCSVDLPCPTDSYCNFNSEPVGKGGKYVS